MPNKDLQRLISIMERLRSPSGCPWDREQDMDSLIPYIIEEAYEVVDAVESSDTDELKQELGDLLFQIVFVAQIAKERDLFDIWDVISASVDKMIRRHPHVFGNEKASNSREALHSWNLAKKKERDTDDVLDSIPSGLPALLYAQKVSEKASSTGFDWDTAEDILDKLYEEVAELRAAIKDGVREGIEDEIGDIIFTLVNIGRFFDINLEKSLRKTTQRFINRFHKMLFISQKKGKRFTHLTIGEMDRLWEEAKETMTENENKEI